MVGRQMVTPGRRRRAAHGDQGGLEAARADDVQIPRPGRHQARLRDGVSQAPGGGGQRARCHQQAVSDGCRVQARLRR
eukprot:7917486-Pyramimonas_sp.AAC.1